MKAGAASILLLAVSACGQPKPKLSDAQMQEIRNVSPGMMEACLEKVHFGGVEAMPQRVDQCFEMKPVQRWQGLWRDAFEGSRFCPFPAQKCSYEDPGENIWLTFGDGVEPMKMDARGGGGLYAIDFVGRRTLRRGAYGHFGVFDHEIIVDRLISMKQVESPPPPMSKAEAEALWKRCEAAGNCISLEKLQEAADRHQ